MKTNYPIHLKKCGFFFIGIVAIITTSCGSYQNVSYYENDGIYSTSTTKKESISRTNNEVTPEKSDEYAQKFRAMQNDYTYFTDVDSYQSTTPQDTAVIVYKTNYNDQNYAGWGNNSTAVTINYYDTGFGWNNWYSPYWGYSNFGWGWNSWYGNNWGWGWNSWYGPNWGYGWNAWYGNGYYGPGWGGYYNNWGWYGYRGRNVAYNGGRRGGNGYYNSGSGRNGSYTNHGRRSDVSNYNGTPRTVTPRNSFQNPRSSQQININPRATGSQSYTPRENSTVTPRTNTSEPRNTNSTSEPRNNNYTPRNNSNFSSPRSSSSGGNFGGGGRSGGGGGRGGRG